eukprot:gene8401-226_t
MFKFDFYLLFIPCFIQFVARVYSLVAVTNILTSLSAGKGDYEVVYFMLYLLISKMIKIIFTHIYDCYSFYSLYNIRRCVMFAVYHKTLNISNETRKLYSSGEIGMLLDPSYMHIFDHFVMGIIQTLRIVFLSYFLHRVVGWVMISSLITIAILFYLRYKASKSHDELWDFIDESSRNCMKIITEFVNSIQMIKYNSLEHYFTKNIRNSRKKQVSYMYEMEKAANSEVAFTDLNVYIISTTTYLSFYFLGYELTPTLLFASIMTIDMFSFPIGRLSNLLDQVHQSNLTFKKMETFLNFDDFEVLKTDQIENEIEIKNASFAWEKNLNVLNNINFTLKKREFVCVVGEIASGKSSLLSSLTGETSISKGTLKISKDVKYLKKKSFIINDTFRNNILFGLDFDQERYAKVIECCDLVDDIESLIDKDLTLIGEKGINLSGGQKSRLNLARICYSISSDESIVLLDDPLSDVDVHVGKVIFDHCLNDFLSNNSKILVTHHVKYLRNESIDKIVFMKNSKIHSIGTFEELFSKCDEFRTFYCNYKGSSSFSEKQSKKKKVEKIMEDDALTIEKETFLSKGNHSPTSNFFYYINSNGSSSFYFGMILLFIGHLCAVYCKLIIESQQGIIGFSILGVLKVLFYVAGLYMICQKTLSTSSFFHDKIVNSLTHATMKFYDSMNSGSILSVFSHDLLEMECTVRWILREVVIVFSMFIIDFISIFYISPKIIFLIIPTICVLYYINNLYKQVDEILTPLESQFFSDVLTHVEETVTGLDVIRNLKQQMNFKKKFNMLMDRRTKLSISNKMFNYWQSYYIQVVGAIFHFSSCLLVFLINPTISSAVMGLLLTQCEEVLDALGWGLEVGTKLRNYMKNNMQKIRNFTCIEQESIKEENFIVKKGTIEMRNVKLKYLESSPFVLKGISFKVNQGEKIGIIGRTGSGKSSIVNTIFRMREIDSGSILIDGRDISKINISSLRSNIGIISQEPKMMKGSIRDNLDPFNEFSDEEIWDSLFKVNLDKKIKKWENNLEFQLTESGNNLSNGELQMLCLARVLLKKKKILILDEATSNVDVKNDNLFQEILRKYCTKTTILVIAHRLNTILDCDKILIIEKGKVINFGKPSELLIENETYFKNIEASIL